jgi:hypothetical protein
MDFRSNEADRIAQSVRVFPHRLLTVNCPSPVVATRVRGSRSFIMDYAKPAEVVAAMLDASEKKLALDPRDLLIRGALSGALLGAATSPKQAASGIISDDAVVLAK